MSNEVMIPGMSALPAYLQAALAANPALLQANMDAANGIGGGAVPTITANQGMFKTKVDGVEDIIQMDVPGMGKINAPKIAAVILAGKPALDRAFFLTAYTAGPEPASPDCSSEDGIKPKADSPNKQCESCAGCPQNMWGSAKLQDGTPGKGKACGEKKRLAIYANQGVYRFSVPPASLGDFAAYARQLAGHGLALSTVITTISFDPATPTKLVFAFQGVLPEAALNKLLPLVNGEEVRAIMQNFTPAVQQLAAPAATPQQSGPSEADKAAAAAKVEADKKAAADKAAADKKAKADKAAADKKAKEEAATAAAKPADVGLGLNLDLGMGGVAETAADDPNLSDEALSALFAL